MGLNAAINGNPGQDMDNSSIDNSSHWMKPIYLICQPGLAGPKLLEPAQFGPGWMIS